jgi:hypothetical protein
MIENFSVEQNTTSKIARAVDQHSLDMPHGTTPAEQVILSDFEKHLDPLDRNPHGLTPSDLDVYTKAEVDAKLEIVQVFDGGEI